MERQNFKLKVKTKNQFANLQFKSMLISTACESVYRVFNGVISNSIALSILVRIFANHLKVVVQSM